MKPVRVMIVDDSAVIRGLLVRALSNTPEITVAATAMHGRGAITQLRRQSVDIVVLDVEMPVLDGLATLPHLLSEFPETRVIMATLTPKRVRMPLSGPSRSARRPALRSRRRPVSPRP